MVRRLFVADAISSFGDWFTYVGISVVAIRQSGGSGSGGGGGGGGELALLLVLVSHTLPKAVLAPLAGALCDRVDRRTMLVAASLGRGAAAAAMVAAAAGGDAWAVQACFLVRMALGAFTDAASRAALPRLVPASRLGRANAILGLSWSAIFVIGVGAGGVTTAACGVVVAFAIDALTFFAAAAVFATLPRIPAGARPAAGPRPRPRLAMSRPAREAVLSKAAVALATGAAWILLNRRAGAAASAALTLGAVHVARAAGTGLAPLVWPRPWRTSTRGLHASVALAVLGAAAFVAAGSSPIALACAAVWGAGIGANWVAATTRLQTSVPDDVLGRAVARDVTVQACAQCTGGVLAMVLGLLAIVAGCAPLSGGADPALATAAPAAPVAPSASTPRAELEARLRGMAVTDDDFYRPLLYTWTTPEAIAELRASHTLLVATATSGGHTSPFNKALARTAFAGGRGRAIAKLLTTDPRLIRRRYAWPAPFATVMGLGDRTYGTALVRIELRPEAWIGRYEPGAKEPFAFVDADGAPVASDAVLAAPERIAAIFHVRLRGIAVRFREYIVVNEGMVASWSIATPEIRAQVDAEHALLAVVRDQVLGLRRAEIVAPASRDWATLPAAPDLLALWHATLAFDNPKYRPDPFRLVAIQRALEAYDDAGEALVVEP